MSPRRNLDPATCTWAEVGRLPTAAEKIEVARKMVDLGRQVEPGATDVLASIHPDLKRASLPQAADAAMLRVRRDLARPRAAWLEELREHPHKLLRVLNDLNVIVEARMVEREEHLK